MSSFDGRLDADDVSGGGVLFVADVTRLHVRHPHLAVDSDPPFFHPQAQDLKSDLISRGGVMR